MASPGLTLTQQPPVSNVATAEFYTSAYGVWREIAESEAFQRVLVETVGEVVRDVGHSRRALALEEQGVTAFDVGLRERARATPFS